jgi:hypothetical protein
MIRPPPLSATSIATRVAPPRAASSMVNSGNSRYGYWATARPTMIAVTASADVARAGT